MINEWENRDDYWTNTASSGFDRNLKYVGYLEIRTLGLSGSEGSKKNNLRMLRHDISEPLRQESAADAGSVLWGYSNIPRGGGAEGPVQEVRDSETRETALAGEQSLLHETVCLPRRTEVSSHDRQGCSKRIEAGLAHGKDTGKRIHAGAAATQSSGCAQSNWDRRNSSTKGSHLPDCGKRSRAREADLVWWRGPLRG